MTMTSLNEISLNTKVANVKTFHMTVKFELLYEC